jgi:hypothetical protein
MIGDPRYREREKLVGRLAFATRLLQSTMPIIACSINLLQKQAEAQPIDQVPQIFGRLNH